MQSFLQGLESESSAAGIQAVDLHFASLVSSYESGDLRQFCILLSQFALIIDSQSIILSAIFSNCFAFRIP
jgi:hypothetical protein